MSMQVDRRAFLKGAGLTAVCGAGLLGSGAILTGCAPKDSLEEQGPAGTEDLSAQGKVIQAQTELNAQDEGAFAATTDCPTLFTPFTVGTHTIPNRIFKPGSGTSAISGATLGQAAYDYFGTMADGGCKFISIDPLDTLDIGTPSGKKPTVRTPEGREDAKKFTDFMHGKGATVLSQISGEWTYSSSGTPLDSFYENAGFVRNPMSVEDIHNWVSAAVQGCVWLKEAGFDGVDINASCDHMFASFLSRFFNKRTDEYGPQSIENRCRMLTDTIKGVREACGPDFIIEVVYSGIEANVEFMGENSECTTIEESCEFAKLIEAAGADMIQVRSSLYGNHAVSFFTDLMHVPAHGHAGYGTQFDYDRMAGGMIKGDADGSSALIDVAAAIKQCVSIPVGPVGNQDPRLTPDLIEGYLSEGKIDFIATNRALIADPEWPNKLKDGRRDEIAPCNKCLTCFISILPPVNPGAKTCRVNPTFGKLTSKDGFPEGSAITAAETPKRVLVVGGGPAGMEAARVCALRGHEVTLAEADSELGGTMTFASVVKGPHEKIPDYKRYLVHQMDVQGVEVLLNTTVDLDFVKQQDPDAVVVATGGVRPTLDMEGSDLVWPLDEAIHADAGELGDEIVVMDDNVQATDTALKFTRDGKHVTLVSSGTSDQYDLDHPCWPRWMTRRWCESKGMTLLFSSKISAVREGSCTVESDYGVTREIECTAVVNTKRCDPSTELYDALVAAGYEAYNIGDSASPATISKATYTAQKAARAI